MIAPNLFLVGFQKCGSSSLFDLLVTHPQVKGTYPKETFFLTDGGYENFDPLSNISNKDCSWNTYTSEIGEDTKYILEGSVCNFYQKNAINYITQLSDAKVIFILRDPVDRFVSNYKYYYGKINGISADTSLHDYYTKVKENKYTTDKLSLSLEHGKYHQFISNWKNHIDEKNIHITSLERLKKDSQQELDNIFNFLGINTIPIQGLPHTNASKGLKNPGLHQKLVKIFGGTIFAGKFVKKLYARFFTKKLKPELSDALRNELKAYYEKEYSEYTQYFN